MFNQPVTEIIRKRYSCRSYLAGPVAAELLQDLVAFMRDHQAAPFGSGPRLALIAAQEGDSSALRGLGTYGTIKNPAGFIAGVLGRGDKDLEDYGYAMELAILKATDMELGTCWLGGTFTKSRFARQIGARNGEEVPAVTSFGYFPTKTRGVDGMIRQYAGSDRRLPWEALFFEGQFGAVLEENSAGAYAVPLEMVRLGPSASNKQPWRFVRAGGVWHLYIQRTPGYRGGLIKRLISLADMQRLDAGIAMCHFESTARELGLQGQWVVEEPGIDKTDELTEYIASWRSQSTP